MTKSKSIAIKTYKIAEVAFLVYGGIVVVNALNKLTNKVIDYTATSAVKMITNI